MRDGGRIVSFSSSVVGLYQPTYAVYAATKAGVEAHRRRAVRPAPVPRRGRPRERWRVGVLCGDRPRARRIPASNRLRRPAAPDRGRQGLTAWPPASGGYGGFLGIASPHSTATGITMAARIAALSCLSPVAKSRSSVMATASSQGSSPAGHRWRSSSEKALTCSATVFSPGAATQSTAVKRRSSEESAAGSLVSQRVMRRVDGIRAEGGRAGSPAAAVPPSAGRGRSHQ